MKTTFKVQKPDEAEFTSKFYENKAARKAFDNAFDVRFGTNLNGDTVFLEGTQQNTEAARTAFKLLLSQKPQVVTEDTIRALKGAKRDRRAAADFGKAAPAPANSNEPAAPRIFAPKNENQAKLIKKIEENVITFGIGPAGTGKTFIACQAAYAALQHGEVEKIFMARPAVSAGADLGAVPGGLDDKLASFMLPLIDELTKVMGKDKFKQLREKGVIEIAPIEHMRGRTFVNSFVIVDETQNTTVEQIKMILTRVGEGSKMVITGDPSQIDLKKVRTDDGRGFEKQKSGLVEAMERLGGVHEIDMQMFTADDVVRRDVVARVVRAFADNAPAPAAARSTVSGKHPKLCQCP